MDLYAPTVSPLNIDRQLQDTVGVTATPEVADAGSNDTTTMFWGNWPATTNSGATAFQPVNIPSNQVCNGSVWCWYSVTDAIGNTSYSDVAKPTIITTGNYPDKPDVQPASSSPADGMNVTVSLKNNFNQDLTLRDSDVVTVSWTIADNGTSQGTPATPVRRTPGNDLAGGKLTLTGLKPAPTANQYALVRFDVERTQYSSTDAPNRYQKFSSDTVVASGSAMYPQPQGALPAPVYTVSDNIIDLGQVTGDIPAEIPSTNRIRPNNQVTLFGLGFDQEGNVVPGSYWTKPVSGIFAPYPFTIPRANVATVPNGGDYVIHYTVDGNSSPTTTAKVKQANPVILRTGTLWGWGDSEYGTIGP